MTFFKKIKEKFKNKKKPEFSKLVCGIILLVIGLTGMFTIFFHEYLQYLAIQNGGTYTPSDTLPVTCVTGILGTFVSYCLYQLGLKVSRNRHNIDSDGLPYDIKNQDSGYEKFKEMLSNFITNKYGEEYEINFDVLEQDVSEENTGDDFND